MSGTNKTPISLRVNAGPLQGPGEEAMRLLRGWESKHADN